MNLNKIFILGRLTRDPEERALPNGGSVSSFGVATNRVWNNRDSGEKQEQTEFHNVTAFGKLADICNQYLAKGQLILVEGRVQTRSWKDQDENKRSRTEIIAENMQMGPKAAGTKTSFTPGAGESKSKISNQDISTEDIEGTPTKSQKKNKKESQNDDEINVEDIPF